MSRQPEGSTDAVASCFILGVSGAFVPMFVSTLGRGLLPAIIIEQALIMSFVGGVAGAAVGLLWAYKSGNDQPTRRNSSAPARDSDPTRPLTD